MWLTGYLAPASCGNRLALIVHGQEVDFHCGQRLEWHRDGAWYRGRIEYSDRLGWYFTDNQQNQRLHCGDTVRVWDGREWPRAAQERDCGYER